MFGKLISRFTEKKSDHPLGSDANLDALIADIPESDPARLLLDVGYWLADIEQHAADIGPEQALRALLRLDQFAAPAAKALLARYLTPGERDYLAESVWSLLDQHAAHLLAGHLAAIAALALSGEADRDRLATCAVCAARALRAWTLRNKLQRFRYRAPAPAAWRQAHDLLRQLLRLHLLQSRVVAYRDEDDTTPIGEYLIGLYLELAPLGNLLPPQIEFVDFFLRACRVLELNAQRQGTSTHGIDLAADDGPRRLGDDDAPSATLRYCSTLRLRSEVMVLALALKRDQGVPPWLALVPGSAEQIDGALMALMLHWAPSPPQRGSDRQPQSQELKVVFGFDLARRMIAFSQFAKSGRSLDYGTDNFDRLFHEGRFGRVATATAAESAPGETPAAAAISAAAAATSDPPTPLETLQKLELAGDRNQMETWFQLDGSSTGLGAELPAVLARHRIGALVCLRRGDDVDWHTGIIRRLGRGASNRPGIGLEILPWPSLSAFVRPVEAQSNGWSKTDDAGHGWLDAILPSPEAAQLLLPAATFVAGIEVDVRSTAGVWRVRLDTLLGHDSDYDRIAFTRLDTPP